MGFKFKGLQRSDRDTYSEQEYWCLNLGDSTFLLWRYEILINRNFMIRCRSLQSESTMLCLKFKRTTLQTYHLKFLLNKLELTNYRDFYKRILDTLEWYTELFRTYFAVLHGRAKALGSREPWSLHFNRVTCNMKNTR